MKNTLHLFDELLEHDPGSKIFLPLARLYRRHGYLQRAIEVVQKGIAHHPDYLEAHFFLIELFYDTGQVDTAEAQAHAIFEKLLVFDKFWRALQDHYSKNQHEDMRLACFLIEGQAKKTPIDLLKLLSSGITHYLEHKHSQDSPREPEQDLDAEEVTQFFINSGIKTKTMAKLLAAQGEHSQAIAICEDLLAQGPNPEETKDLESIRQQSLVHLQKTDSSQKDNNKLYSILDTLATRLETRSSSKLTPSS